MKSVWQFIRFLVVGVFNSLFGYSVFAILILAGAKPGLALSMTYVVGVAFNFLTTRRFVFNQSRPATLPRFVGAYLVIYLFNLALYRLVEMTGVSPLIIQGVCLPIVAVFSFALFKTLVFKDAS